MNDYEYFDGYDFYEPNPDSDRLTRLHELVNEIEEMNLSTVEIESAIAFLEELLNDAY